MQQISENLIVLSPGDQMPVLTRDAIKLYLGGTIDFGSSENDWQGKFIQGLQGLLDPVKGLLMYKGCSFIVINPKIIPTNPAPPTLENPEFVAQQKWRMEMMDMADVIFLNIMKKSVSPIPVLEFGLFANSGKLVVRTSEEYQIYSQIRLLCEKYSIPLLTGKITAKDILLTCGGFLQKFTPQTQIPD